MDKLRWQVYYALDCRDAASASRVDAFMSKVENELGDAAARFEETDRHIWEGAVIFACQAAVNLDAGDAAAAPQQIFEDLRAVSLSHEALHGPPMDTFVRKYYKW